MDKYDHASTLVAGARTILKLRVAADDHELAACRDMLCDACQILDKLRRKVEEGLGCMSSEEEDDSEMPDDVMSETIVYHKDGSTQTLLELKKEIEQKLEKTSQ